MHRRDAEYAENGKTFGGHGSQALRRFAVLGVLCAAAVMMAVGCSTAPVQRPTQTIAPDSTTDSSLRDVQAKVISLAQQNTAIINAIQKSAQDADTFRTETKGGIASLTQNQFRVESWLAETTRHWRLRVLGVSAYPDPGALSGNSGVGVGGDLPGHPGLVPGSAVPGADRENAVVKKGGPSVLTIIIAFVLGVLASQVFAALEPQVEAKINSEEQSVYVWILKIVHGAWAMIFGKAKTTATK
jgi:hypothetical protein